MTRLTTIAKGLTRDAFLVLATLAIALKIMIPAGFMPDSQPRNGLPFAMVLCTGEGAKVVQPGDSLGSHKDDKGGKPSHDAPCPFAAQGPLAPPPAVAVVAETQVAAYAPLPQPRAQTIAPGRGLAAPPPPSRGPPSLLI